MSTPFFHIRGVIEGFYGVYYTSPQRDDLIRFLGQHNFNLYIYAPKNDRQHRNRWWEPYPQEVMEQFAQSVALARAAGVDFCYASSPISYAYESDFERLSAKLRAFYDIGVRSFSLMLDDLAPSFVHHETGAEHQISAELHIAICNRVYRWLQELDPSCSLSMCPTDYHGSAPFSDYLHTLGAGLHPAIDIFYTGPEICSRAIWSRHAAAFAKAARRQPLIWDNYPVNDLAMRPQMHIGPIRGRGPGLHLAVKGLVTNLMTEAEASKIALLTFADYFADPVGYDPWRSWKHALRAIGGASSFEALCSFAENSLVSCLQAPESPLDRLARGLLAALKGGVGSSGNKKAQALTTYLDQLDHALYHLRYRMRNLRLRQELLPWIEALEHRLWLGRHSLEVLELSARGAPYERPLQRLQEVLEEARGHHKRVAGATVNELAEYIIKRGAPAAQSIEG